MTERIIKLKIVTSEDGQYCSYYCPYSYGSLCYMFGDLGVDPDGARFRDASCVAPESEESARG